MSKPNPLLGLIIGVVAGWLGVAVANYASTKVALQRTVRLESDVTGSLPWLLLLVAVAVVLGLLMAPRAIGAGVQVGTGLLMAGAGLAVQVLPIRTAFDLSKLFDVPGSPPRGYLLWDGSLLLLGVVLLVVGIRRWGSDAKSTQRPQDIAGYYPSQPPQYQPGPQPPYQPGQQQPYHPGQQQPPRY